MNVETVTAIIAALGGPVLIIKALDVIKAARSGRAAREKAENRSALGRLADAEAERDDEATFRRRLEEYASRLRRMLLELGVQENKIPEWPVRKDKASA